MENLCPLYRPGMLGSLLDFRGVYRKLWFKDAWDAHLALVKFAYNNSCHSSIEMAPYEALYGRQCRTPICWNEVGDKKLEKVDSIRATNEKVKMIKEKLIGFAVAQYCLLWAPLSALTVLSLGAHEQLPSG
ncbi:unnamed protein product [Prunus armeniaca]